MSGALLEFQRNAQDEFFKVSSSEFITFTGQEFRILDFCTKDVRLEDIAHGLSNMCRYGGQCKRFYSVAEHSILVSKFADHVSNTVELTRSAFLHDGSEAYLGDLPTPIKILCPGYKLIEERFEREIFRAFGLQFGFRHPIVKECDYRMYIRERSILMPGKREIEPSELDELLAVRCLSPEEAKRAFLERAEELNVRLSRSAP